MTRPSATKPRRNAKRARATRAAAARAEVGTAAGAAAPTWFDASTRIASYWSQWAEQMQRVSNQAALDFRADAEAEADELQRAPSPLQRAGLPLEFAAEGVTRWIQLSVQLMSGLLDMQARWVQETEAFAAATLRPWLGGDRIIRIAPVDALLEPPPQATTAQLLQSAQQAWSESAKVWLNALSHDLQDAPAATTRR
jgi:hypothetical protein